MPATYPAPPAVLLVDDEGCIRASVSRVLERAGYVVSLAASGAEALERVRAELGRMCARPAGGAAATPTTAHQKEQRAAS
jgi:CheY-like chemotaxis protein